MSHLPDHVPTRLALMRHVAAAKVSQAHGAPQFWQEVEANLEAIAVAKLAQMAPINTNLLGFAFMLLEEVKRLRNQ